MKTLEVFPCPQEYIIGDGSYPVPDGTVNIFWQAPERPSRVITDLISETGFEMIYQAGAEHAFWVADAGDKQLSRRLPYVGVQGYILKAEQKGIQACANDPMGLFYAFQTLKQLIGKDKTISCVQIVDKPNTHHRGIMIDLARVVERPDYIISLLPFLSQCRLNQIYLYLENKLSFSRHPELAHPMAWKPDDVKRLVKAAAEHYIDIIPMPATMGHMESILKHPKYAHLRQSNTTDHLCVRNPEAKQLIGDVLDDLCELFPSPYVHLAGDECPYLGKPDEVVELYADFVTFMCECLRKRGKRGILWGDMVLHNPQLKEILPKDVILVDWRYGPLDAEDVSAPETLMKSGFDVAVAPGILADEPFLPLPERLERNIPYFARRTGLWGVINCLWEPRTQTLPVARMGMAVAGACGWNPFGQQPTKLLSVASCFTYGEDITDAYCLLATNEFFDRMMKTRMNYYHAFEFSCIHPLVHMTHTIDSWWQKLESGIEQGLYALAKHSTLRNLYPNDYQAMRVCGELALCLARSVTLMQEGGSLSLNNKSTQDCWDEYIRKIREFADFLLQTLAHQRKIWNHSRFDDDENFRWWFEDPLQYKRECLLNLAQEIETKLCAGLKIDFGGREMFCVNVSKGQARTWNLLRLQIFYSDDNQNWKQIFFRTVPLWMGSVITINFMPKSELPKYIMILPSCWTWHPEGQDWSDMLEWKAMRTLTLDEVQDSNYSNHPDTMIPCKQQYRSIQNSEDKIVLQLEN